MPTFSRLTQLGLMPALETRSAAQPEFFLVPSSGVASNGLLYFNWDQGALQLDRAGASWAGTPGTPTTVTYGFRASGSVPNFGGISTFGQFNASQIQAAEEALRLWAEVANITFVRVGSGTSGPGAYTNNASILFANFMSGPPQFSAFAYLPDPSATAASAAEGDVWVNGSRDYDADPLSFSLGAHILIHEIGHAIGLLHPSDYDGGAGSGRTYGVDADFYQDTLQFTNMSYFSETETGAYYAGIYASAPQMFDIAAAQYLYGANMTTRTGDTVYGFNSNTGHSAFSIANSAALAIFCIWDAGGVDTLDLSGYSFAEHIDLREMSFSSAGATNGLPLIGNISIARGVVIENAIGGSGNDEIIGNGVDNVLTGGAGSDVIDGGGGIDRAAFSLASSGATWTRTVNGAWVVNAGGLGTDLLTNVEFIHFNDRDVHLDMASRTFSGDGTSDVLFRRDDGVMAVWSVIGTSVSAATFLPAAGAEWTALGTGDTDADHSADIVWARSDGLVYLWQMSNGGFANAVAITGIGAEWSYLGIGDFNGDLRDDIAWQRDDGVVYVWQMNGAAITAASVVAGLGADWSVQGVGDFNGDGRDDFLWRNDDGQTVIWQMNGAAIAASSAISMQIGNDWSIVGVGDTNGDGYDDIILQHAGDGQVAVWSMQGATVTSAGFAGQADPSTWTIENIGDYDGNGRDDILWRNADGVVYVWLMNGATIVGAGGLSGVGAEWDIVGGG
ncbi:M10 family metallopeptidase C-terminal domain-containing protein [Terricaulis sp.]|uniref:M10 family metallopeptidase C-terminal domain-containing protein n=1 Tax=Terricaulis sp. TaxID=2768686 RepID=UPI003783064B